MHVEDTTILVNEPFQDDYRRLVLESPRIAEGVQPGQFVHLRIPRLENCVLRRPFSVFEAASGRIGILYKAVGRGTRALTSVPAGEKASLLGPLGRGFPVATEGTTPVFVAGGYGVAPLSFLASRMSARGHLFVGGRTSADILTVSRFEELGWEVSVATEDGSMGARGLVTVALDAWLGGPGTGVTPEFFACGPDGLLHAVGDRAIAHDCRGWLSLDKHMGCGAGACLACVQKVNTPDGSVKQVRVCKEGPVFEARELVWESGEGAA